MDWKAIRRDHQGPHVCLGTAVKACAVGNPQPRRGPGRPKPKRAAVRGRNFKTAMAKFERIHRARRERNDARRAVRLRSRAEV